MTKKSILFALSLGPVFLLTAAASLSVQYRLCAFYPPARVTLLTGVLYGLLQAVGIAAYAALVKAKPSFAGRRRCAAFSVALTGLTSVLALLIPDGRCCAVCGLLLNIGIGLLSGVYLTRLAATIPQQHRGRVFGCSYAMGGLGAWLLSLSFGGRLLRSGAAVWVVLALTALPMLLTRHPEPAAAGAGAPQAALLPLDRKLLVPALCVPLLCSIVNGLGYYLPAADLSGALDPAFARVSFAVGLVAAGVVSDRNRRYGAVCCIIALIFPFVGLALRGGTGVPVYLTVFCCFLCGFFSVYRAVLFADLAGKRPALLHMAAFGLLTGRVGGAAGTLGGMMLAGSRLWLTCAAAGFFIVCALMFFTLYHRLYVPRLSVRENAEALLCAFETRYTFTARQSDIFRLLVKGCSNAEISSALFLAESTVKFHIRNILNRTGCANRTELVSLYKSTAAR